MSAEAETKTGGPLLIGWKEYVDLPEWGIRRLKIKVDTGAKTSALDVHSYDVEEVAGEGLVARLRLVLDRKRPGHLTEVRALVVSTVVVRNSGGKCERRPVVETEMRLGPVCKRIRLTVTNRSAMVFRMLLGRRALAETFLVDVSKKYVQRSKKS